MNKWLRLTATRPLFQPYRGCLSIRWRTCIKNGTRTLEHVYINIIKCKAVKNLKSRCVYSLINLSRKVYHMNGSLKARYYTSLKLKHSWFKDSFGHSTINGILMYEHVKVCTYQLVWDSESFGSKAALSGDHFSVIWRRRSRSNINKNLWNIKSRL